MGAAQQDPDWESKISTSFKGVLKLKIGQRDPIMYERWLDQLTAAIGDKASITLEKSPPPVEKWATQVGFTRGDDASLAEAYKTARAKWEETSRSVANIITRSIDFTEDTLGTYASDLRACKTAKAKLAYIRDKSTDVSSQKAQSNLITHFHQLEIIPKNADMQRQEVVLQRIKYALKTWLLIRGHNNGDITLFREHVMNQMKERGGKCKTFADTLESTQNLMIDNSAFQERLTSGEKYAKWRFSR